MCLVCIIRGEQAAEARGGQIETKVLDLSDMVWYFAIGSMTNTTILALRDLKPLSSRPALLRGWRIRFVGSSGMASAEECSATDADEELHGVLHLMTRVQMVELDRIEGGYARTQCVAHLYDGTRIQANVYQMEVCRQGRSDCKFPPSL